MLILRVVTRRNLPSVTNGCHQIRHLATQAKVKKDLMTDFKQQLPAAQPKKPKRDPFVKNLFLGKFDYEFLAYPEPQHYDRYNEFEEWIRPLKDYMNTVDPKEFDDKDSIPPQVLQKLRELGVFGSVINEDYRGINLLHSEFMQVVETIGRIPSLGLFFLKYSLPAIDFLNTYGSVEQKLKYFPKFAAGLSIPTVAITEEDSRPGADNFSCIASLSDCENYWILEGEKTFVANNKLADVFIVVAHGIQSGELNTRPEDLSTFIVDKDTEGVHIQESFKTLGLKGFSTGKVLFKGAKVPKENMVGKVGDGQTHLIDIFTNYRHTVAPLAIAVLKNHLKLLVDDLLPRKQFDKKLRETDSIRKVIADVTSSIYSMESVLYMTTSMIDIYDNQDVQIETALTEQYCVQECLRCIQESISIIGPRASLMIHPFEQILRDAFTLTTSETSLLDTKIYTALLGIQHYGLTEVERLKKVRNPFMFPKEAFKRIFFNNNKMLKLHTEEYLHPSLMECADFLDRALYNLKESTEQLLIQNGVAVAMKHVHLFRLSDMVAQIYVYISIISRASRSYCIGNRDADSEVKLCMILAWRLQQRVNRLAEDIKVSEYSNGDYLSTEIGQLNFEKKGYCSAHPLQRNY